MQAHPLAEKFPLMDGEKFASLKTHIERHGQQVPIVRFGGKILDGRNRARALSELGVPRSAWAVKDFEGTEEQAAVLVQALNLERRNLTPEQERNIRAELVQEMHVRGMSQRAIAEAVGVSLATVNKDINRQVFTGRTPDPAADDGAPPLVPDHKPATVTGRDGKRYAASRGRKKDREEQEERVEEAPPPPATGKRKPVVVPGLGRAAAALLGVGVIKANEAINCLIQIPPDDAQRARGFQIVADWVKSNK